MKVKKGVKMTQNRSKRWAIDHAFWSKMTKNGWQFKMHDFKLGYA